MRDDLLFLVKTALPSKRRAFLTLASVPFSFCLPTVLTALYHGHFLAPPANSGHALRLAVQQKISLTRDLPLSFERKIAAIPAVKEVTSLRWLGGTYKDVQGPKNNLVQFGIEPAHLLDVYPAFTMPRHRSKRSSRRRPHGLHCERRRPSVAESSGTLLTETQQGMAAHDLVGYDRVANKFLRPDAGEPAYKEFQSKGWTGPSTTLPHVARSDKQMAANRHVDHADNPAQFSVCGEEYENGDWKPHET
jgi:hypothetical protein